MKKSGPVVLIGFKGCGKSSIGKILAEKQKVAFADTDTAIEALHKKRKNEELAFREIYKKYGADYFNALELTAVKSALSNVAGVISLGGGTLINIDRAEFSRSLAIFVYISVKQDTLFKRIMADGIPAFFDEENPRHAFDKIFAKREPIYKSYADIAVDNTHGTVENVADEIILRLKDFYIGGQ